jgi:hypothetical protein
MQAKYPVKVQVIRSSAQKPRLYISLPLALASAIDMQAGEEVEWELLSRGELHLIRSRVPPPRAKKVARK